MIEAVNSVLQTAPLIRATAEQMSASDSFAANPDRVQKIPQAPYISPYIHLDVDNGAVLQLRDSDTGDVVQQIPSEATIEARHRFQQQIDILQRQQEQQVRTRAESATAGNGATTAQAGTMARMAQTDAPAPQQQASVRRSIPQPQQIAAFQSASLAGSSSSSGVQLFA